MTTERSTKRQRELLTYVDTFIREHGYGPSYREIMNGLGYKSVSTVAIHIEGLISKGYLHKRDNSARSLEVVSSEYVPGSGSGSGSDSGGGSGRLGFGADGASSELGPRALAKEKWLVEAVESRFTRYRQAPSQELLDELYVLVGALKVLGFDGAYQAMRAKLSEVVGR